MADDVAEEPGSEEAAAPKSGGLRRFLPLAILAAGFALFFALGLQHQLSLEALKSHRAVLESWVAAHPYEAMAVFAAVYIAVVAFSIPGAAVLTLTGGFLFGTWRGGTLVVISATIGATIVFLAAKTALAGLLRARMGARIAAMEDGFRANALSYLLVLRLVPAFPFFLVNLAAGLLGVRLGTYVLATALGIVPGTFVYAGLGNGLGAIFDAGGTPDLGLIFKPQVLWPLIGLAVLSLLPIVWRVLRRKSGTR